MLRAKRVEDKLLEKLIYLFNVSAFTRLVSHILLARAYIAQFLPQENQFVTLEKQSKIFELFLSFTVTEITVLKWNFFWTNLGTLQDRGVKGAKAPLKEKQFFLITIYP